MKIQILTLCFSTNKLPQKSSFLSTIFKKSTDIAAYPSKLTPSLRPHYSPLPPFNKLQDEDIYTFTNYSFNLQLKSPFRWTPLIQRKLPTKEFYYKMQEFSKRRYFSDEQCYNELIDALIFEALKGTPYDFYYDYKCEPSKKSQFHGVVPFLIYHKSHEFHLPLIPVVKTKKVFNTLGNIFTEEWNLAEAVGAGLWALDNMKAVDSKKEIKFSRVLQTSGNTWRLYEFDDKGGFKKTGYYVPKNQFKKIYDDIEMQEIVIGLIRFALSDMDENEKELKTIYDYLDDRQYFQRIDEETRQLIRKRERFWKFLPKRIRTLFFNE